MEAMTNATFQLSEFLFEGYTPRQKRDNIRFVHGLTLIIFTLLFIFAPSRSFGRYLAFTFFVAVAFLYKYYGSCWVTDVEERSYNKSSGAILDPVLSLIGIPRTKESREIVVGVGYLFVIILMSCLVVRDMFGVY